MFLLLFVKAFMLCCMLQHTGFFFTIGMQGTVGGGVQADGSVNEKPNGNTGKKVTSTSHHHRLLDPNNHHQKFSPKWVRIKHLLQKFQRVFGSMGRGFVGLIMRGPCERGAERIKELRAFGNNNGSHHLILKDIPKIWNGITVTENERLALHTLNTKRLVLVASKTSGGISPWIQTASSTEFLRFLRHRNGNIDEAWTKIIAHAKWRISKYGADTIVRENAFEKSELNREVFWLGMSKQDCPTLVIRTKAHDGADYNEDPKVFTSFIVSLIEQGRKKFGVAVNRPVCLILDRGPYERHGEAKIDKMDMSVIPNLVKLFQHLYGTIMDNYPELLLNAKIVPASWFFSTCYKITSRVMDARSRDKFVMVKSEKVARELGIMFPKHVLPPHMGGTSAVYGTMVLPKGQGLGGAHGGMGGMLKRRGMGGIRNDTQRPSPHHRWGKKDNDVNNNNNNNDTKNIHHNSNNNNNNNNDSNNKPTTRRIWQLNLRGGYADDHERCCNNDEDHDDAYAANSCTRRSVSEPSGAVVDQMNGRCDDELLVHGHSEKTVEKEEGHCGRSNRMSQPQLQLQPQPHQIHNKIDS